MKTKKSLSELFEQARNEGPEAPVCKLLSLVENGKISPLATKHSLRPRRIKQFFNPLKILIMITAIAIITSALLIWNPIIKEDEKFLEKGKLMEKEIHIKTEKIEIQSTQAGEIRSLAINEQNNTRKDTQEEPPKDLRLTVLNVQVAPSISKAATVIAANNVLHATDTFQKQIPQTLVKSKPIIKSEQIKKEQSPKVANSRKTLYTEQNESKLSVKAAKSDKETKGIGVQPIELDSATMSCIGFDIGKHSIEMLWQGPDQYDRTILLEEDQGKSLINGTGHKYKRRTPSEYEPVKYFV
jgi:hypothetical protein